MVQIIRAGSAPNELTQKFELSPEAFHQSAARLDLEGIRREFGFTSEQIMELRELRRKLKR